MKIKKIYEEMKTEKIIPVKWVCEKCKVWAVTGNGIVMDVNKETEGKGASINGGEDETSRDCKINKNKDGYCSFWGEDVLNGASELLVGYGSGGAEFHDAGSDGIANRDKIDLVLVFGLIVQWCLCLMPAFVLKKIAVTDFANFTFPSSIGDKWG